uniref:C2H2-type domain-containing protein n=1 Tax=Chloropicon laureae TaxID=464258 RepID=A0A7S3DZW0_9CHLO
MSRAVKQPVGQKRLTNIAVVRYKTHGTRFEIACYKNKVFDWRQGSETDLDEVLQTDTVFLNVSKGVVAKEKDLKKAFGKEKSRSLEEVCKEILAKGELQVSDRERALQLDSRLRDVASIIVEKCVDRNTKRPFPHALVERALKDPRIRFIPDNRKSAKQQMLEVVPKLQKHDVLSIERAKMRIQLTLTSPEMKRKVLQHMKEDVHLAEACVMEREHEDDGSGSSVETYTYTCVLAINPGAFRSIDALVRGRGGANGNFDAKDGKSHSNNDVGGDANANATSRGEGKESRLEILDLAVHEDASQAEDEAGARRRREDNERSSTSRSDSSSAGVVTEAMRCVTINTQEGVSEGEGAAEKKKKEDLAGFRFKCNTCQIGFNEQKLHREHFKSDWHRINLKRKSQKLPIVSQEECEAILLMESTEASDLNDYM